MTYLRDDIKAAWDGKDPFAAAQQLNGEVYREVARRRTLRVSIEGQWYFAKLHWGVGWWEIAKNWLTLRPPVLGAANEYMACRHLEERGIPAPRVAAFGEGPGNPAERFSFIVCDELAGYVSLEDVVATWPEHPPSLTLKRSMLRAVAAFARDFHGSGLIHRDFYICHLLADRKALECGEVKLAVLDLHRARKFADIPHKWLKRDLAALLFSSLDLDLTPRDWLRFLRVYRGAELRKTLTNEGALWRSVEQRARKLKAKERRKGVPGSVNKQASKLP